jgi:hypothetical protein
MTFPVDDLFSTAMPDGLVKSPDAALRFILPLPSQGQAYCGAFRGHVGTPCGKVSPHVPDASFLRIRAPCLRPFYEAVPFSRLLRLITSSSYLSFPKDKGDHSLRNTINQAFFMECLRQADKPATGSGEGLFRTTSSCGRLSVGRLSSCQASLFYDKKPAGWFVPLRSDAF